MVHGLYSFYLGDSQWITVLYLKQLFCIKVHKSNSGLLSSNLIQYNMIEILTHVSKEVFFAAGMLK